MVGAAFQPGNTLMTDSVVGDKWITEVCAQNPTVMLPGETRLISTGPIRLSFCDALWEPRAPTSGEGEPKYGCTALYPPMAGMDVFYAEYYRICQEMFQSFWNPHLNPPGYSGLENPFLDCATKAHKFQGFTPGLWYMNHTAKFKPQIVDASPAKNIITDPSKVYSGCWAILVLNAYGYGVKPPRPKKGVSFGLKAVMLIGEDTNLAMGGGVDPREVFKGVNVKPPMVNPATLAGLAPPMPGAPPMPPNRAGVVPGYQPQPTAPGGYVPPPPPNPLWAGMQHTKTATDEYDISSLA